MRAGAMMLALCTGVPHGGAVHPGCALVGACVTGENGRGLAGDARALFTVLTLSLLPPEPNVCIQPQRRRRRRRRNVSMHHGAVGSARDYGSAG